MARQIRNFFPEGMYHILQRGHNRSFIFGDISDKYAYIRFFKEALLKYPMDILYYVLMDNHVHLIVRMKELEPSQAFVRSLLLFLSDFVLKCTNMQMNF